MAGRCNRWYEAQGVIVENRRGVTVDEQTRKAWSRPELIVIVRGKLEEAVLTACKIASNQNGGSGNWQTHCLNGPTCVDCSAQSTS